MLDKIYSNFNLNSLNHAFQKQRSEHPERLVIGAVALVALGRILWGRNNNCPAVLSDDICLQAKLPKGTRGYTKEYEVVGFSGKKIEIHISKFNWWRLRWEDDPKSGVDLAPKNKGDSPKYSAECPNKQSFIPDEIPYWMCTKLRLPEGTRGRTSPIPFSEEDEDYRRDGRVVEKHRVYVARINPDTGTWETDGNPLIYIGASSGSRRPSSVDLPVIDLDALNAVQHESTID